MTLVLQANYNSHKTKIKKALTECPKTHFPNSEIQKQRKLHTNRARYQYTFASGTSLIVFCIINCCGTLEIRLKTEN